MTTEKGGGGADPLERDGWQRRSVLDEPDGK